MKRTEFKYKIMRIRSKISFYAFMNHMTIAEHIASTIQKVVKNQEENGLITSTSSTEKQSEIKEN